MNAKIIDKQTRGGLLFVTVLYEHNNKSETREHTFESSSQIKEIVQATSNELLNKFEKEEEVENLMNIELLTTL